MKETPNTLSAAREATENMGSRSVSLLEPKNPSTSRIEKSFMLIKEMSPLPFIQGSVPSSWECRLVRMASWSSPTPGIPLMRLISLKFAAEYSTRSYDFDSCTSKLPFFRYFMNRYFLSAELPLTLLQNCARDAAGGADLANRYVSVSSQVEDVALFVDVNLVKLPWVSD